MSLEELGTALAQARIARGITLHDAERDTRINREYLQALEEGKLEVMPAPVYARAFMRTYAQYLGMNARTLVQQLPGARPEPELPPLPQVGREASGPLVSASWLVAGVVVVLLLGLGLLLFWNRGGDGDLAVSGPQPVDGSPGLGAEQFVPEDQPPPLPVVEPGVVPDLEAQDVLVAIDALRQAQIPYIVIEAENGDVPADTVFGQSPAPGTEAEDGIVVTLTVSR